MASKRRPTNGTNAANGVTPSSSSSSLSSPTSVGRSASPAANGKVLSPSPTRVSIILNKSATSSPASSPEPVITSAAKAKETPKQRKKRIAAAAAAAVTAAAPATASVAPIASTPTPSLSSSASTPTLISSSVLRPASAVVQSYVPSTSTSPLYDFTTLVPLSSARCTSLLHSIHLHLSRNQHAAAILDFNLIIAIAPTYVPAYSGLAQAHKALADSVQATSCIHRALSIDDKDWTSHDILGMIYKEKELYEQSIEQYRAAIQYGPVDCVANEHLAVVLTDYGTKLKGTGATDKAVQSYMDALKVKKEYWPAYFNLGVVYSERREFELALKYYHLSIDRNPNYVEALCNVGVIFKNSGDLAQSISYYERALKANPNFAIANSNLSIALTDLGTQVKNEGRVDEGIAMYKRALHHHSKYPAAWYNLGVAYSEKARFDDAKVCYEMAGLFDSKCAEAFNNLGVIFKDRGNLDQAIHYYNLALAANPNFSQTMNNLGVIYTMLGKLELAHDYCSQAIRSNAQYAEAHNNLGVLYRDEGRIHEAIASYESCLAIEPHSRNAGQNRLLALNSLCESTMTMADLAEMIWMTHKSWGAEFAKLHQHERYTNWDYIHDKGELVNGHISSRSSSLSTSTSSIPASIFTRRPLRIGYISADFFTHSVSYFIEAPLTFADPTLTHITCYSSVARTDKKTQHLQNLAHSWRSIHDQSAKVVAEQIRADKIDILVELTGHTAGNRLDVLALRPAPIAVTWIGYPNTTGCTAIDYRITDAIVDPLTTQQQYSEELVRMDGLPFLCYTPPSEAPAVAPTPAMTKGYITFGSFNNLAKVNDTVLAVWCRILHAVPNSRMLIKCKPFASQAVCTKIWSRFTSLGIPTDRVDLVSLLPTTSEHLDSYSHVDISVDTFPYAGTTTTCEALYCGVPVVTYERTDVTNHAHNVGATLLRRIDGMKELIANSEDEYVSIAVSLARDLPRLQSMRSVLRPSMINSSLCDGPTFVASLTRTYQNMFKRYNEKKPIVPSNRDNKRG